MVSPVTTGTTFTSTGAPVATRPNVGALESLLQQGQIDQSTFLRLTGGIPQTPQFTQLAGPNQSPIQAPSGNRLIDNPIFLGPEGPGGVQSGQTGVPGTQTGQLPGTFGVQSPLFIPTAGPNQSPLPTAPFPVQSPLAGPAATGQFGLPIGQGVPGGSALDFLESGGFPVPDVLRGLRTGVPARATNIGATTQALGGIGIPSLQSLNRLGPSGVDFLAGLFETLLGIPFADIFFGAMQPTQGLEQGRRGRQSPLGLFF